MPDKQLSIALTEPVVFLRSSDPSGRHSSDPNDPPALVRGILTLNVAKPIAISTIEVELFGTLSINHPEDLPQEHRIFSSTVTVFRADKTSRALARHSVSVGPRLSTANSNEDEHRTITSPRAPSLPRGRPERRNVASVPLDLGPTPPYTEMEFPLQPAPGVPGGHPAQVLQPSRLDPRDGTTEGHEHGGNSMPSPSRPLISLSLLDVQPDPSITSNDTSHRECDHLSSDSAHRSPPLEDNMTLHTSTEEALRGPSPDPSFRAHSPEGTHGARSRSHGNSHDPTMASNSRLRLSLTCVLDAVKGIASRTPSRSRNTAKLDETERGRSRVRNARDEQGWAGVLEVGEAVSSPGHSGEMGPHTSPGHSEHREHNLLGLGRIFGLGREHDKDKDSEQRSREQDENWRELKPGLYSFPISFLLPPHLPPTFSVPNGSLKYTIKAVAHRPGAFTPKLSCHVPLLIVTAPDGDGSGDPGPLFIQQQWHGQLAYSLALSSRLFLLGSVRRLEAVVGQSVCTDTEPLAPRVRAEAVYGAATLDLTLLPIEKMKIWRLAIFMDQRVKYVGERGQPIRHEEKKQVMLMELHDMCTVEEVSLIDEEQARKNKHKHKSDHVQIPLLPTPISPHRSPLLQYLSPSTDPSTLAGPGPYSLSVNIGLPGCDDPSGSDSGGLHFSVKQKSSSVNVEHFLRINMRVEHFSDNGSSSHEEGKKLFDIALQTPVTILSCRCVPEYLPRYSQSTEESLQDLTVCACHENGVEPPVSGYAHDVTNHFGQDVSPNSASSHDCENGLIDERHSDYERSRTPSHAWRGIHANPPTPSRHSHPPSPAAWASDAGWTRFPSHAHTTHSHEQGHHHHHHTHAQSQSLCVSTSHVHAGIDSLPSPLPSPHHSRPPSPLTRYERLVSGLESEVGEAPPSYESLTSGP